MAKTINIKKIAELIDEEPFNIVWFSYLFNGGWGTRFNSGSKGGATRGRIVSGIDSRTSIGQIYDKLLTGNFNGIAGFYVAILAFFGEKIYKKLTFVDDLPRNSISTLFLDQKCPEHLKENVYTICHSEYDFIDFIDAASRNEALNFDAQTAIATYKLQGDAVIYPLLCQMFYVNRGIECLQPSLVDGLPVQLPVQVSNYLSGCHFPVAVSPYSDEFKWAENQNGHFLYTKYEGEWRVLDVVGVGFVNLSNYSLANRLNYVGGGGLAVPYLICWSWGEIINAYHYFGGNLLIRDLRNDIFNHYWFNFGPNTRFCVRFVNGYINGQKDYKIAPTNETLKNHAKSSKPDYITLDLKGNFIEYCKKEDIVFSDSEAYDIFEIGKQL